MSTATVLPGHHSPVCAAAALTAEPLSFCSSLSGWLARPLKDISHACHQIQHQMGLCWVLCTRYLKWGVVSTGPEVPEEAPADGVMLLREHMQSK